MSITASAITPDNSLEEFRVEFNKLIQDFDGVASGNTFDQSIIFEGATADAFETTLIVTDPTADRTITLPNVTGTVITTGNSNAGTTTSVTSSFDKKDFSGLTISILNSSLIKQLLLFSFSQLFQLLLQWFLPYKMPPLEDGHTHLCRSRQTL